MLIIEVIYSIFFGEGSLSGNLRNKPKRSISEWPDDAWDAETAGGHVQYRSNT